MKITSLIVIICLLGYAGFSQYDTAALRILNTEIRKVQRDGIVFYTNSVNKNILDIETLTRKDLNGLLIRQKDFADIQFSSAEFDTLKKGLNKATTPYWTDHVLPDSKMIPLDSFTRHLHERRLELDSLMKIPGMRDSMNKSPNRYINYTLAFQFSDVVFLRNKNLYVVFLMWYNGSGGSNMLMLRKKLENGWSKPTYIRAGSW
ncbi:MAG: hypothetical protein C5B52_16460 [Bacteroidetes bacterium]|nr:MAG: hypothetical protein C5B52_16460 [Bacteroidota bacterium]